MTHRNDRAVVEAAQAAILPFDKYRPETVSPLLWAEYVQLMTAAGYGKVRPAGAARLQEIYKQEPKILEAGRHLDFSQGGR